MKVINKNVLAKSILLSTAAIALAAVPFNKNLTFGYGSSAPAPASPPKCETTKPASAPRLLSAVSSGNNSVTLTWSKASDPVSYYLVTFGTKPGEQLYGNPNVGGHETTSYTVSQLSSNQTYYFKVRAGNGCMPGDFSNEVAVQPYGAVLANVPQGFQQGVLGAETKNTKQEAKEDTSVKSSEDETPAVEVTETKEQSTGFFQSIINFFKRLFGGQ